MKLKVLSFVAIVLTFVAISAIKENSGVTGYAFARINSLYFNNNSAVLLSFAVLAALFIIVLAFVARAVVIIKYPKKK